MDQLYYYEKLFIIHWGCIKISFLKHTYDEADGSEEAQDTACDRRGVHREDIYADEDPQPC